VCAGMSDGVACEPVRGGNLDLSDADVIAAAGERWLVHAEAAALTFPEGGGRNHWRLTDRQGQSLLSPLTP